MADLLPPILIIYEQPYKIREDQAPCLGVSLLGKARGSEGEGRIRNKEGRRMNVFLNLLYMRAHTK